MKQYQKRSTPNRNKTIKQNKSCSTSVFRMSSFRVKRYRRVFTKLLLFRIFQVSHRQNETKNFQKFVTKNLLLFHSNAIWSATSIQFSAKHVFSFSFGSFFPFFSSFHFRFFFVFLFLCHSDVYALTNHYASYLSDMTQILWRVMWLAETEFEAMLIVYKKAAVQIIIYKRRYLGNKQHIISWRIINY